MKWLGLLAVIALLGSVGCAYDNPTQPGVRPADPSVPSQVTLGASPGTGTAGGTATVTARVQNANGAALANVMVTFTTTRGSVSPVQVATSSSGAATATLTASDTADVTAIAGTVSAHTLVVATPSSNPTPTPTLPLAILNVSGNATVGVPLAFGVSSSAVGATWIWSFGDGASEQGTAFTTTHIYNHSGTYTASVSSSMTTAASAPITVVSPPTPAPAPPAATPGYTVSVAASPTSVVSGGSATLTATVTAINGAPTPTSFAWDCNGDGVTILTSSNSTQSCTYPAAGSVNSKVVVTGGNVTGTGATVVTVTAAPTPSYTVGLTASQNPVVVGNITTLTAAVTAVNGAPTPTSYKWDCNGDGVTTVTTASPGQNCTYATAGAKTPNVVVSNGAVTGTGSTVVTVTLAPLFVNIVQGAAATAGNPVTFTATVTSAGAVPALLQWQWDDTNDGTVDFVNPSAASPNARSITFVSAGLKTVKVTVTDVATGRTASNVLTVSVS